MLDVKAIEVSIGRVQVLRKVSLQVPERSMIGIVGRNGAGKTTLMRAIMGLLSLRAGDITFLGLSLKGCPAHSRAALAIGYAPEDRRLIPELTVEENLMIPVWATGTKNPSARLEEVYDLIPEAKLMRSRRALHLSGGQQKLVAIGRACMSGTKLLLLDEPFEGVAPALSKRISEVVSSLRPLGLSIVLSGADLQHTGKNLDRVYKLDRGEIVSDA